MILSKKFCQSKLSVHAERIFQIYLKDKFCGTFLYILPLRSCLENNFSIRQIQRKQKKKDDTSPASKIQ